MKQKKIANIVLVLAFAGFLAAAMVITLGKTPRWLVLL